MSLVIELDMSQIEKYKTIVKVAGERLIPEIDRAVATTVNEGKRYISEKTPVITGNLRRGFQVLRLAPGVSMIYNLVKYFMYIETGECERNGKIVRRRAGPARMVQDSIQEIRERLAENINNALIYLLHWRQGE